MADKTPKRSRLEEEVLEILERSDRPPSKPIQLRSAAHRRYWRTKLELSRRLRSLRRFARRGGWTYILGAIVLYALSRWLISPVSPFLAQLVTYVCLAGIVIGFVQLYRGSRGGGGRQMWRGRPMDLDRPGSNPEDKFQSWRRRR